MQGQIGAGQTGKADLESVQGGFGLLLSVMSPSGGLLGAPLELLQGLLLSLNLQPIP